MIELVEKILSFLLSYMGEGEVTQQPLGLFSPITPSPYFAHEMII